ncbi:tRNA (N6-isopentenyl adenosine(37)-C2)-methylthiotransferase MiaB [Zavarzinia sp. CC-PAN008]|uniref:tRNA (N6-isopentenyl adenosine(37)-C2)-methylthiotransferase MiaB n=1 Tax=Zavarzinia sp. CC-PAN008 TaxID=3243332 RepID=UPI003F748899
MAKTVHIKTYGCQMNAYDSGRMADVLAPLGYRTTEVVEGADMVILNTCHIREKAGEKVFSDLGRLRPLKQAREAAGAAMTIVVAGCTAQAEGEELRRRAPIVDVVVGPLAYHRLPELVAQAVRQGGGVLDTDMPAEPKFDALPAQSARPGVSAFLTVQEGCDKFCSFCVVPYTRGAEYSRPVAEIVDEARHLLDLGAREIVLLGQNVNAYRGAATDGTSWSLGRLIERLAELPGLSRLRYTTSHPLDVDDALVAAHRDVPALMPFLHLPVQSGSDRILAAMNRRHDAATYLRVIERLRKAQPALAFSSDFIVGFPGESERDFQATMALVREVGFAQAFSFKYSARPGTPAANLDLRIDDATATARLHALQAQLWQDQEAFNRAQVGRVLPVLIDGPGRHSGQVHGRSPYMQAVHAEASTVEPGTMVAMRIVEGRLNSLVGEPAAPPAAAAA